VGAESVGMLVKGCRARASPVTPTCTVVKAAAQVDHNWGSSLTPAPSESRPTLRSAGTLQGVPPSCCGVWSVHERTIRVWRSGSTRKQPANLAVEGAEESLSILPDYTPTVRPPPKRS
jgi:hypothetical protein